MVSVEVCFSFWFLSLFLNADRPLPCNMFGYTPTTSIVHKAMSSGKFGRVWSFLRSL